MDVRIRATKITERFSQTVASRLEDKPLMFHMGCLCPAHNESKFKGHVEARCPMGLVVELDSREIVKGVPTLTNELKNTVEASSAAGDLKRGPWNKTEAA